jgi:glc operon protein GlcG
LVVDLETAKALVLTVPTSPLASIPADLVYFEKMQDAQTGSVELAIEKARTAALFRRPTKVFEDGVAAGGEGLRLLRLTGAIPIDGGVPIIVDGKVVGAVGVSGGSGAQDGQVAKAGANAVK